MGFFTNYFRINDDDEVAFTSSYTSPSYKITTGYKKKLKSISGRRRNDRQSIIRCVRYR